MKASIIELDKEMTELVTRAISRESGGEELEVIPVPRQLLLRLYSAWACARLKELASLKSEG